MNLPEIILAALLVAIPILIFYTIITYAGPSWDIMVRYLNGRTVDNFLVGGIGAQAAFLGEFTNNMLYYFEPYREPLSTPIFALLSPLFKNPILPYLIIVYLFYLLAAKALFKELGVDWLLGLAAVTNSYLVFFLFVLNGGEALAVVFIFLALALLLRKSKWAGLLFGIAAIAKYPALILLPLVLFLKDRKLIAKAVILELLPLAVWGLFGYLVYGNPLYSYMESLFASNTATLPSTVYPIAILAVVAVPLAIAAVGALVAKLKSRRITLRLDRASKIIVAMVVLAGIGYALVLPHNDLDTQARYGFIFSIALLLAALVLFTKEAQKIWWFRYAVAGSMVIVLLCTLIYAYYTSNTEWVVYYNPDLQGGVYSHAYSVISSLGFGGCRFISNAWVPMIYSGYDAYSPFILGNGTLTPITEKLLNSSGNRISYAAYQEEELRYPILVFRYIGVSKSEIQDLNGSVLAYSDGNVSVYLPNNATCYRD